MMPRPRKKLNLPAAAVESLAAQLAAISARSPGAHARLADRIAVTVRPCRRDGDVLPEGRVPFDAFRLFALSHRWVDRRGRVTPVAVLSIHRPEADLPGTGRIRFRCEAAMSVGSRAGSIAPDPGGNPTAARAAVAMAHGAQDAEAKELGPDLRLPRFYYAFEAGRQPVREAHVAPGAWAAGETRIGDLRSYPAECFARPKSGRWNFHPLDGTPNPWADRAGEVGEGATSGSWIVRDGVATPRAQEPDAIFADLGGLGGRAVRNPAWQALAGLGVIDPGQTYRRWLEATCPLAPGGRRYPTPGRPTPGSARFLADLAGWVDADAGNVGLLLGGLRGACLAAGIPVPEAPGAAEEFLLGLAEAPWTRVEVPGVAGIQCVRLSGHPGPATLAFSAGAAEADLHDLGGLAARYESVPAGRVAEAFRRRYGRSTPPISAAGFAR